MAVPIRGESDRLAVARPDRCGIVRRASRERLSEPSPCRDQKKMAFETERDRFPVRRDRGIAQPKRLRIRSERFVRLSVREAGDRAKQCRTKRDGQSQQSLIQMPREEGKHGLNPDTNGKRSFLFPSSTQRRRVRVGDHALRLCSSDHSSPEYPDRLESFP
jgi:hypothetical protein